MLVVAVDKVFVCWPVSFGKADSSGSSSNEMSKCAIWLILQLDLVYERLKTLTLGDVAHWKDCRSGY